MKKTYSVLVSLLLVLATVFVGCKHEIPDDPADNPADPVKKEFTVTFETDGGSAIDSIKVEEGATLTLPEDPTKDGYKFEGWFTDEDLTAAFDKDTAITKDLTLYAKWSEVKAEFTVTFESNEGSEVEAQTVKDGETATTPEDPTKDGAYFAGWYSDEELKTKFDFGTAITADITLYAKWSTDPVYTITINYNYEGSKDSNVKADKDGEYKVDAPTAERKGYKLEGWYAEKECKTAIKFEDAFAADTTIYAKWSLVEYKITYELDGGTNSTDNPASYTIEDEFTLKPATKDGVTFEKWCTDKDLKKGTSKIVKGTTGDITLYAKYINKTYTYTYTMASFPITMADNPDGKNFQAQEDATIPADVVLKKGDTLKLTLIGSVSNNVKGGISAAIVDNTEAAGWWKVLSSWDGTSDDYAEKSNIELSFELEVTEDQVGSGSAAHKIVLCCSNESDGPVTIWEKDHDFDSKEIPIYMPAEAPSFTDSQYDGAAVIQGASSVLQAGDLLTFYYTITDPDDGYAQLQLTAGWSATALPGTNNQYGQINLDMSSTSTTYTLTEEDVALFDSSAGDQFRISGHNITLSKVTRIPKE